MDFAGAAATGVVAIAASATCRGLGLPVAAVTVPALGWTGCRIDIGCAAALIVGGLTVLGCASACGTATTPSGAVGGAYSARGCDADPTGDAAGASALPFPGIASTMDTPG